MAPSTEEQNTGVQSVPKKRYIDSNGVKCPRYTFLRGALWNARWYAKISVGGKQIERKSPILERSPGSREAIQAWVIEERNRLQELHDQVQFGKPKKPIIDIEPSEVYELPPVINQSSVGAVTRLELDYQREAHPGSPAIATVELHLARIDEFFGRETETTSITMQDTESYIAHRRSQLMRNGQPPTYETIDRELATFMRAIKAANVSHVFKHNGVPFKFELPVDQKRRKSRKKHHVVNEKQRSQQFNYEQCIAWIEAAKGTPLEHYTYLAYNTGMRSYEMQSMSWSWVHRTVDGDGYGELRLPKELYIKSDLDDRPIVLSEEVYLYIQKLAQGKPKDVPLLGKNLPNISEWTAKIARRVMHLLDERGSPIYIHLRSLRASYGRLIYRLTGDIRATQIAMRHRNMQTTIDAYVRAAKDDYAAIAKALDSLRHKI